MKKTNTFYDLPINYGIVKKKEQRMSADKCVMFGNCHSRRDGTRLITLLKYFSYKGIYNMFGKHTL
jgi:hypothetical protein